MLGFLKDFETFQFLDRDRRFQGAALDQLPPKCAQFRGKLPVRAHPTLEQLEGSVRKALNPKEAYNMVPGRDPENA